MRALVTRHYKTLLNASGQILGWEDSPPDISWKADLNFVASRLHEEKIGIDAVYSSGLERARITARCHASYLGIKTLCESDALNEVRYGQLSGRKKTWVAENYPLHKKDPDFVYPGGESFHQMQQRSVSYLSSLTKTHAQQTLLIVVHAGVIRGMISHFLGLDYAANLTRQIPHCYIGDFQFDGETCTHYCELGEPSGFLREGVICPD